MAHPPICPPFKSFFSFVSMTPTNRSNLAFPDSTESSHAFGMNHTIFLFSQSEISFFGFIFLTLNESEALTGRSLEFVLLCLFYTAQINSGFPSLVFGS